MRKIIAAINMTIDGFCDHTVMVADEEIHDHYTKLLNDSGIILYGRTTYELMEGYWPTIVKNPTGTKSMDDFAMAIENIPKIVFSNTMKNVGWKHARLAKRDLKEEVLALKQSSEGGSKDILIGSRSLIVALTKLDLIDEHQLCVHPVIVGSGLPLFKGVSDRIVLNFLKTKNFGGGAVLHYYGPGKN